MAATKQEHVCYVVTNDVVGDVIIKSKDKYVQGNYLRRLGDT